MDPAIGTIIILFGQAIALVMRLWPNGGINPYIPKVVWFLNFLGVLAGFAKQLLDAIGPVAAPAVSALHTHVLLASSWGSLFAVFKVVGAGFAASLLSAISQWVYEHGTKPAIPAGALAAGKK